MIVTAYGKAKEMTTLPPRCADEYCSQGAVAHNSHNKHWPHTHTLAVNKPCRYICFCPASELGSADTEALLSRRTRR